MGLLGDIGSLAGDAASVVEGPASAAVGAVSGSDPNLVGDMLTGGAISNAQAVEATNAQNIAFAQGQDAFQMNASNTAYQRAVADMTKAGLNPMLAYSQGGASTPSGTTPSLTAPQPGNVGAGLFNTAKAIATGSMDIQAQRSSIDLNTHQAALADANADKATANATESGVNADLSRAQIQKTVQDTKTASERAKQAAMDTQVQEARQPYDKKLAPVDAVISRISDVAGAVSNAVSASGGRKPRSSKTETFNGGGEMISTTHHSPMD